MHWSLFHKIHNPRDNDGGCDRCRIRSKILVGQVDHKALWLINLLSLWVMGKYVLLKSQSIIFGQLMFCACYNGSHVHNPII